MIEKIILKAILVILGLMISALTTLLMVSCIKEYYFSVEEKVIYSLLTLLPLVWGIFMVIIGVMI